MVTKSKQEEYDEESDSDSDSLDLADLDIDLDNIDALDINELQKKQQALLELRNKKQKKLEEVRARFVLYLTIANGLFSCCENKMSSSIK